MAKQDNGSDAKNSTSIMYYLSAISLGFSILSFMMVYLMVLKILASIESTNKYSIYVIGIMFLINMVFSLITYSMSLARAVDYDCWAHPNTINNPIKSSCIFDKGVATCDYDGV